MKVLPRPDVASAPAPAPAPAAVLQADSTTQSASTASFTFARSTYPPNRLLYVAMPDKRGPSRRPAGEFKLAEVPTITPHCCQVAESLRLLLRCIWIRSIFRASPLPSARARSEPPGGVLQRLGVVLWPAPARPGKESPVSSLTGPSWEDAPRIGGANP